MHVPVPLPAVDVVSTTSKDTDSIQRSYPEYANCGTGRLSGLRIILLTAPSRFPSGVNRGVRPLLQQRLACDGFEPSFLLTAAGYDCPHTAPVILLLSLIPFDHGGCQYGILTNSQKIKIHASSSFPRESTKKPEYLMYTYARIMPK